MKVETRQKADVLASLKTPLDASGSFASDAALELGYAELSIFGVSDQPFSVEILESADPEGKENFVRTSLIAATLSAGQWSVCERLEPCGVYLKTLLQNLGGEMTSLGYQVLGLPLP